MSKKYNIFGFKLSFKIRKVLSKFLGSSCMLYSTY